MNFEFKKIGGIAKLGAIRYSTPGQGARTRRGGQAMNFEFKKVANDLTILRAWIPAFAGMTQPGGVFKKRIMNFELKKFGIGYHELRRPHASGGRDATRYTVRQGARTMNFEFKKMLFAA